MSCGVGCRCGLDPALLCSGIAIAIAPIQPLSWEPPYASGVALKRKKKKKGCYINLVDKTVAEFERIDSNFGRRSTLGKMLSNSIACYREILRKSHCFLILRNCPSHPQPSAIITLTSQQPSTLRQEILPAKKMTC